ncbi:MAG: HugZ family protein [Vogesella sp.]|uniref:HugZ family pyridoxamine 5'-phosphate oxidase n=1 Tax=Vogesella sp. TaxID=1904252 RepID=UPI00391D31AA
MNIPLSDCLSLLHRCQHGALATHSQALPGYPFVTSLPFAIGPDHSPWLLMSGLAEHCRNVQADPRVSLLLQAPAGQVWEQARMTLSGELVPQQPSTALLARLLRYAPAFEPVLALGDFRFYRLQVRAIRYIGGVGRMGWVSTTDWDALPVFELDTEATLLPQVAACSGGVSLLGVDSYGVDYYLHDMRQRLDFGVPVAPAQLPQRVADALSAGELR